MTVFILLCRKITSSSYAYVGTDHAQFIACAQHIGVIAFAGYMYPFDDSASTLPFILDDLGCNGSESNLLECLPQHNCGYYSDENAGVRCLRKGILFCLAHMHAVSNQSRSIMCVFMMLCVQVCHWNMVPNSLTITVSS